MLLLVESSFRLLDWWARRARRNEIPAQLQRSTLNLFDYPRTYYVLPLGQASPRIGLWMFVFSSAAAYGMWQAAWPDPQEQGVVFGAFIAIATVGACILLNVLTSRLILRADEIEWRRLMDGRRIHRGDILGVRGLTNGPAYVVALRDEDAQTLYVPRVLRDDEAFRRWFESLPVLAPIEDDDEEEEELGSAR